VRELVSDEWSEEGRERKQEIVRGREVRRLGQESESMRKSES
jgi:hypothetical protein